MTKLPKLTADVFNRPQCPKWAKYAAVDMDGDGFFFSNKPTCGDVMWMCHNSRRKYIRLYDPSDWRNSLIERPEEDKQKGDKNMKTLPKLTADIFNRPDCPEWAKWAAVDKSGECFVYSIKPAENEEVWVYECGDFCYIGDYDSSDWRNSLIARPATESESPAADLPEHDDVKAPSYYVNTPFGLEVRKITEHYDSYLAAALKYIFRNGQKVYDGLTAKESAIKDLRKAIQNIKFEIEKIENSQ